MKKITLIGAFCFILTSCSSIISGDITTQKPLVEKVETWAVLPQKPTVAGKINNLRVEDKRYIKWDKYPGAAYYRLNGIAKTDYSEGEIDFTFNLSEVENADGAMYDHLGLSEMAGDKISDYTDVSHAKLSVSALDANKQVLASATIDADLANKPVTVN